MPQVRDNNVVDGYYKNASTDADGQPRPWSAATLSFRPGQVRFVSAAARLQSRSVNQAFELALANGRLLGPFATAAEAEGGKAPEPAPEAVKEPEPAAVKEPEPVVAPEDEVTAPVEVAPADPGPDDDESVSSSKRRRRRRSSSSDD